MANIRTAVERVTSVRGLIIAVLFLHGMYGTFDLLTKRPQPHHLWRQTDCISLAWNYYDTTWNLFEPAVHDQFAKDNVSGRSAGEFPLLYWIIGMLWRITGPSEAIYRIVQLLLHLLATIALFDTVRRTSGSSFWAFCVALLLHTSPVLVFFSSAFLTDVPALDLALIGWWCVVRYSEGRQIVWWNRAMLMFTIAMLLKVTAGMSFVALSLVLLYVTVKRPAAPVGWFRLSGDRREWYPLLMGFATVIGWYAYAEWYNGVYDAKYTFNALWPIWDVDDLSRARIWEAGTTILFPQLFDRSVLAAILLGTLLFPLKIKYIGASISILLISIIIGVFLYVLLWFQALDNHDYYFINPLIFPFLLIITAISLLHQQRPRLAASWLMRTMAVALLLYNVAYARTNMHMRLDTTGLMERNELWPRPSTAEVVHWNNVGYGPLEGLLDIRDTLANMGIDGTDKVIFLDDGSINASLVLMGNRGWTNFGWGVLDPGVLDRLVRRGARYLMFVETKWLNDERLVPFLRAPLGKVGKVRIFDLLADRLPSRCATVIHGSMLQSNTAQLFIDKQDMCADGTTLCLGESVFPLTVEHIVPHDPHSRLAELMVQGTCTMAPEPGGNVFLVFTEDSMEQQVSYHDLTLSNGLFSARFVAQPERLGLSNKLYLYNPASTRVHLHNLQVEVMYYH